MFFRKVDDLLDWLRKMRTPDESLFATLHFNPSLNMPGSPKGLFNFNPNEAETNGRHFADDIFKCIFLMKMLNSD